MPRPYVVCRQSMVSGEMVLHSYKRRIVKVTQLISALQQSYQTLVYLGFRNLSWVSLLRSANGRCFRTPRRYLPTAQHSEIASSLVFEKPCLFGRQKSSIAPQSLVTHVPHIPIPFSESVVKSVVSATWLTVQTLVGAHHLAHLSPEVASSLKAGR